MKIEPTLQQRMLMVPIIVIGFAIGFAMVTPNAGAQPDRSHLAPLTLAELQAVYLDCDLLATRAFLDGTTAAECSLVAQELLVRGFDGNFDQLLEWWRAARKEQAEPAEPETDAAGML